MRELPAELKREARQCLDPPRRYVVNSNLSPRRVIKRNFVDNARNKIRRVFTVRVRYRFEGTSYHRSGCNAAFCLASFFSPALARRCLCLINSADATLSFKAIPFHGTRVEGRRRRVFRYRHSSFYPPI